MTGHLSGGWSTEFLEYMHKNDIARQCDWSASSFAEVTVSHCCSIYIIQEIAAA